MPTAASAREVPGWSTGHSRGAMSRPTSPTSRTPQGTARGGCRRPGLPIAACSALLVGILAGVLLLAGDHPRTAGETSEAGDLPTTTAVEYRPGPPGAESPRSIAEAFPRSGIRVLGRSARGVEPVEGALVQLLPREPGLAGLPPLAPVATSPDGLAS